MPLRVFKDGDLLDPGSDPLIALLGALSDLNEGERVVARLLLRSLGPEWSLHHSEMAHAGPAARSGPVPRYQESGTPRGPGWGTAVLGLGALAAYQGYTWVQAGEAWKTVLLGLGAAALLAAGGWAWGRWKASRSRVFDPAADQGEGLPHRLSMPRYGVVAVMPTSTGPQRAEELLEQVVAAYRHYENPAGARFRMGKAGPTCTRRRTSTRRGPACSEGEA